MKSDRLIDDLVNRYISTDAQLSSILSELPSGEDQMCDAMHMLCKCLNGTLSANAAFLAAKRVDVNTYRDDIFILFMSCWANVACSQSPIIAERLPEAWALIQRAKALVGPKTAPEIVCYMNTVESYLCSSAGNHDQQEQLLSDSLSTLGKDSPRRNQLILEYAANLALGGRLKEASKHLESITMFNEHLKRSWVSAIRFINLVETGNAADAGKLISELSRSDFDSVPLKNFQKYQIILHILSEPAKPIDTDDTGPKADDDSPDWAMVLQCLLSNKIHQALRWARICEKNSELYVTGKDFTSFNLLRSELAESNIEAARRIMEIRHNHGNHHYIDNLFLSRIAILDNDHDTAAELFSKLLKDIYKYDALGRLNFELRISTEMQRDTLFRLISTAQRISAENSRKTMNQTPKTQPIASQIQGQKEPDTILYTSSVMSNIMSSIHNFAQVDVPVLITGETGTGKELAAKALHDSGPRSTKPFVALNCGAISESLLESELFGHIKGAFSGASVAHKGLFEETKDGTIFLDEIGDITPRLQVALLRVLETNEIRPVGSSQSKAVSCRIIASTNADLQKLEQQNQFRSDLIYRLRRLEITMPPLRDRREDILMLTNHFLNIGRPQDVYATMTTRLAEKLLNYSWPGNIRELRNNVERMRLMNSDKLHYDADDIELGSEPALTVSPDISSHTELLYTATHSEEPRQKNAQPVIKEGKSKIRRLANLRIMFAKHKVLTRTEIATALEISPCTATSDLKNLCSEGYIRKVQPSASPRSIYFEKK